MRHLIQLCILFFILITYGCTQSGAIKEIKVGLHHNNYLKIQMDIITEGKIDAFVEYWPSKQPKAPKEKSIVSKKLNHHQFVLANILPKTNYNYQIVTNKGGTLKASKIYSFESNELPEWLKDQFKGTTAIDSLIPKEFKEGLILVNKRYSPGVAYLVDYKGRLRWYHMIDDMGFKVINFTKEKTLLSILGSNDEPTSYGSQILEVNLDGDTLLNLKKGQGDFKQTIHHEILRNKDGNLVTLVVDQKITDLTKIGGSKQDTINGDGILVMDKNGKKIWQWSVFDDTDPLTDKALLKTKKDWTHANSLSYDKDDNYIISFYNTGQIWKVDASNGKVIWKFGKGGNIKLPKNSDFTQAHAAHINVEGNLMFFDNGIDKKQSGIYAFKFDENKKTADLDLHIKLPEPLYNDRMGSAYMIDRNHIISCISKRHIVVLMNRKGTLLWTLEASIPPYRAIFITKNELAPYLRP